MKTFVICVLSFVVSLAFLADPVLAQSVDDTFLREGTARVTSIYQNAISIVYTAGAIGLIILAVFSFIGKFKWAHFAALCGGLFVVAMADQLVTFLGG